MAGNDRQCAMDTLPIGSHPWHAADHRMMIGRGGGIRTPDIHIPNVARYQTALHPESPMSGIAQADATWAKAKPANLRVVGYFVKCGCHPPPGDPASSIPCSIAQCAHIAPSRRRASTDGLAFAEYQRFFANSRLCLAIGSMYASNRQVNAKTAFRTSSALTCTDSSSSSTKPVPLTTLAGGGLVVTLPACR